MSDEYDVNHDVRVQYFEEGFQIGQLHVKIARRMLEHGLAIALIAEITEMSEADILRIAFCMGEVASPDLDMGEETAPLRNASY